MTPPEHFENVLGGYPTICVRLGLEDAHWLWENQRLYTRDQNIPVSQRWAKGYQECLAYLLQQGLITQEEHDAFCVSEEEPSGGVSPS